MGWKSHNLERYINLVRFWNKLNLMNDDRLTKNIFDWDYDKPGGWSGEVKKVFMELGLIDYFLEKRVCDLRMVKSKIQDIMENKWRCELNSKPKLRSYRLFKI